MAGKTDAVVSTDDYPTHAAFLAAVEEQFGPITRASEYGGGELVEKETLIGVPFVVLDWRTETSDKFTRADGDVITKSEFVIVNIVTQDNKRLVFTDGGTGILPVLQTHFDRTDRRSGIFCAEGLRVSNYTYTNPSTGQTSAAKTYYLA